MRTVTTDSKKEANAMTCETVVIQVPKTEGNPTGLVTMNRSDYDANPTAYTLAVPMAVTTSAPVERVDEGMPTKAVKRKY